MYVVEGMANFYFNICFSRLVKERKKKDLYLKIINEVPRCPFPMHMHALSNVYLIELTNSEQSNSVLFNEKDEFKDSTTKE
jgi:hypothetical protein